MSRAPEAGSPAPIKAVVFDLWYTLVYIEGEHEKHERENTAIQAFFREARMDVPLARYRLQMAEVMNLRAWEPPEEGYRELARRVRVPPDRLPAFLAIMKDKYEGAVHARAYPDVLPCLRALRSRGVKVGLVSNVSQKAPRTLDATGLSPFLDAVAFSFQEGIAKPDLRIFRRVLDRLCVRPGKALMVGDNLRADILPARQLGMRALLLAREGGGDIASLAELEGVLGASLADVPGASRLPENGMTGRLRPI